MKVGEFDIGFGRTFVIAEIGNNHNGSYDRAVKMIDKAVEAGADCVKFQMRNLVEVYRQTSLVKQGEDLGTEYILDLLGRFELTVEEHRKLAAYAKDVGVLYMCTPWDEASVQVLEGFGVEAYKVASADLTNMPLISRLVETKKPLILSTGMARPEEIQFTTDFLNGKKCNFAMLHCNSTYPAPFHDINLRWLEELKRIHPLIGYSGHERGISVSLAAVALGASVIERHFTLDRGMEGPDHAASLEFDEFVSMIEGIRQVEEALGDGGERIVSQGEMINRENLAKSLVAACDLSAGTRLRSEHLVAKSPGQGISPQKYDELVGRILSRDMKKHDYFYQSDIDDKYIKSRDFSFLRPWGVPVRYHDMGFYLSEIKPNFIEFHLSYSDMDLDIDKYINQQYACGFVVHAPELFADSQLMDLTSPDERTLNYSLKETQRVIEITRSLKEYFPQEQRPMIVANIGGFSMDDVLGSEEVIARYEAFEDSLGQLNLNGVELIPQTMAPFPWHFGGQRYQNLFVHPTEIAAWCKRLNLRICFDVSHSRLTCNHFGYDFYEFCELVAPFAAHLHIGDARGVNGEGLQIGDGEIDFSRVANILNEYCPNAPFIPEIWQGHKNNGEGFWLALDRLEGIF